MKPTLIVLLVALVALTFSQAGAVFGSAEQADCADWPVNVYGAKSEVEAELACSGAADAVEFLLLAGLYLPPVIRVDLVDALPSYLAPSGVGCYEVTTQRVVMLRLERFLLLSSWFGVPIRSELFRSAVAHEVAHALVGCHLGDRRLPLAAHEYLAYVTMFATMHVATRDEILAVNPGGGFERAGHINDLVYAIAPELFGVECYRHWVQQPDGAGFLRRVLAGEIVSDLPP